MLNLVSILIGLLALPFALVGVIPFPLVPMLNWIAFPIALVGAVIGMLSRSKAQSQLPRTGDQRIAALPHRRADLALKKGPAPKHRAPLACVGGTF